jgi:ketosteroid isomerase-like protein
VLGVPDVPQTILALDSLAARALRRRCGVVTMSRVNAEDVARRYIELSNEVDYEAMADLFAIDADWIPITPMEPRKGREAIREGYLEQVKHTNRPIINARYYADGDTCVAEFEVDLADGKVAAIVDVFTLNSEGKITRLAVYRR